jgi:hypothetical protein
MNGGRGGRGRDTYKGQKMLIFEAISGMSPHALRVHRFFNIPGKGGR